MLTFRLADSLPEAALEQMQFDLLSRPDQRRRRQIEMLRRAGHGACHLRDPRVGRLVERALLHFDRLRYHTLAYVVMPNHVHALIDTTPGMLLAAIVQSWKSFTGRRANALLGLSGQFWYPDYFDRVIRDERHLRAAIRYIHENPVKAGLVEDSEAWPFSSARRLGPDA